MLGVGVLAVVVVTGLFLAERKVRTRTSDHPAEAPQPSPVAEIPEDITKTPRTEIDPFATLTGAVRTPDEPSEKLLFSNTLPLGEKFRAFLDWPARIIGAAEKSIVLPPFPANSSLRTERELKLLHEYVALRTPARMAQIREEMNLEGIKIGTETLQTYTADPRYAKTGEAITQVLDEINPVVMRLKVRYDRVRAHKLDPTLTTVIDVPEHPAYPSGHSTQAYSIAFLLTVLAPDRQAEFESDALRVAVNREIAGVHYPSDSAAGMLLARQIVDLMLQNSDFLALVEEVKKEWLPKE